MKNFTSNSVVNHCRNFLLTPASQREKGCAMKTLTDQRERFLSLFLLFAAVAFILVILAGCNTHKAPPIIYQLDTLETGTRFV